MPDGPDIRWMRLALEQARKSDGLTSPNPPVGAVLVSAGGELLSTGRHRVAGGPHAEVEALRAAGKIPRGSTLYVTLEPCSTHGKTPPCTEAICAAAGAIRRVVWAIDDPNPSHAGRAAAILEKAGIRTASGVLQGEAADFLAPWRKFILTGMPYVVAKAGMSADGRITLPHGEGQWITGVAARRDAMRTRLLADAIVIGAETLRRDNPRLTLRDVRIPSGKTQPWRVILTRTGNLPQDAAVFTDSFRDRTLVCRNQPLRRVLRSLAQRGIVRVLIEGGGTVLAQAFAGGLVDEFHAYVAPRISGSGKCAVDAAAFGAGRSVALALQSVRRIGADVKLVYLRASP